MHRLNECLETKRYYIVHVPEFAFPSNNSEIYPDVELSVSPPHIYKSYGVDHCCFFMKSKKSSSKTIASLATFSAKARQLLSLELRTHVEPAASATKTSDQAGTNRPGRMLTS
jgi:hypothetical protein